MSIENDLGPNGGLNRCPMKRILDELVKIREIMEKSSGN